MTMYGANPEELRGLGASLTAQIERIDAVTSTVDGVLNGTNWTGPARDRFVEEWNNSFKSALGKLNEAFGAAGKDCTARSEELRRVMGIG